MKTLVSICIVIIFNSCSENRKTNNETTPLPEAMQETKSESFSKRTYNDPVNTIFENLIDSSEVLKNFDDQVSNLPSERADSLRNVTDYKNTIDNYYSSALTHLKNIQDSVLRKKITGVIDYSMNNFSNQFKNYASLMDTINTNFNYLNDQHEALKVLISLPVIHEYQKNNRPSIDPLKKFNGQLEKRKLTIDSVIIKYGG